MTTKKKRVGPQAGFSVGYTIPTKPEGVLVEKALVPVNIEVPHKLHFVKTTFTLQKGGTTDDEGLFTKLGIDVMTRYSNAWLGGQRDLELERQYPELAGSFYDVRSDSEYARRWADDIVVQKSDPAASLEAQLQKAGLAPPPPPKLVVSKLKKSKAKGFFDDIIG